jgi:hypothetical protein
MTGIHSPVMKSKRKSKRVQQSTKLLTSNSTDHIRSLMTRKELAARWGVCSHTIQRRRDLQPVRLGPRLVRYRLKDVEEIEAAAAN